MQFALMQAQTQPLIKLAQANMDLLTRFSTSAEVGAEANNNASQLFQQANESAMKLMQSGAFTNMMQGMLKNYSEFLSEISQSSLAMWNQGQAAVTQQVQEVSKGVVEVAETASRRSRQAA